VRLQEQLAQYCREQEFLLCGPNCLGIIDAWQPLTATFASSLSNQGRLARGNISMVGQSGGTAMTVQALAQQAGFGFRLMISSGNEAVLGITDYLEALLDDDKTAVIAVYLEGVRDGASFAAALARARSIGKPIVMLKAGLTAEAGRAAAAHTGALVGDDRVWQSVVRDEAVISVRSTQELVDVALYLSNNRERLPRGTGVAIVSFGGGIGVLGTDLCARNGLTTPPLSERTREKLIELTPPIAALTNPIDVTPATFEARWLPKFPDALATIAADPGIDTLLFPLSAMARGASDVATALVALRERTEKAVCVSWTFAPPEGAAILERERLYTFPEPSRAIETLGHVTRFRMALEADAPSSHAVPAMDFDWRAQVPNAAPGMVVTEDACHRILAAAGLPVAAAGLATTDDAAARVAAEVGLPVAMKGITPAITHRAAAGLLALDLRTEGEVREGYRRLASRARELEVTLDGVYVQHMTSGKLEVLVSAFRDPVFGVMVACGAGGTLTEIIDDVALTRAPVDAARAQSLLQRLRIVQRAGRIDPQARLAPVAQFVSDFSRLAASVPWRHFVLEVNPIKWSGEAVTAVDGLLIVEDI
jgi:acetyltransferase